MDTLFQSTESQTFSGLHHDLLLQGAFENATQTCQGPGWKGKGAKWGLEVLLALERLDSLAGWRTLGPHRATFHLFSREQTWFLREAEVSSACSTLIPFVLVD